MEKYTNIDGLVPRSMKYKNIKETPQIGMNILTEIFNKKSHNTTGRNII